MSADGGSFNAPGAVDWTQAESLFCRALVIAGDTAGEFTLAAIWEEPELDGTEYARHVEFRHPPNGPNALQDFRQALTELAAIPHANLYLGDALFTPFGDDRPFYRKGKVSEIIGVWATVDDFDKSHKPETRGERRPVVPHGEVETSPGNFQGWVFLDKLYPSAEAAPVFEALQKCLGSDSTQSTEHVFRIPGTANYPTQIKIDAGRSQEPYPAHWAIEPEEWEPGITLDNLRDAILAKKPDAFTAKKKAASIDDDLRVQPDRPAHVPTVDEIEKSICLDCGAVAASKAKRSGKLKKLAAKLRHASNLSLAEAIDFGIEHFHDPAPAGTVNIFSHYRNNADLETDFRRMWPLLKPRPGTDNPEVFRTPAEQMRWEEDHRDKEPAPKRTIELTGGYLATANKAAGEALLEQRIGIFKNGSRLVKPTVDAVEIRGGEKVTMLVLAEATEAMVREALTASATFLKWSATKSEFVEVNCPAEIARGFMEGHSNILRPLAGIVSAPTIRADGTILDRSGWDEATWLLYEPRGVVFPVVPPNPSRDDALAALGQLKGLVREYNFETDADRSAWLSYVLTCVCRRTLETAPLHIFTAPVAGAGKGKLVDAGAIVATGSEAPSFSQGGNGEELEKRLASALLLGHAIVSIDNCSAPVQGDFLNMFLTQRQAAVRILGQSRMVTLPSGITIAATGNNLVVAGDTVRRTIRCGIDPAVENPEARRFDFDPVAVAHERRAELLVAALTLLRAHALAGYPEPAGHIPMSSFETWDERVRCALMWLDEADPYGNHDLVAAEDEEAQELGSLISAWHKLHGSGAITLKEAVAGVVGIDTPEKATLHDAILAVAADRANHKAIDLKKLGNYLKAHKSRIVGAHRFVASSPSKHDGRVKWRCV